MKKKGRKIERSLARKRRGIYRQNISVRCVIYIHTHAHTFVYHQPRSPQQLAIQFVSAPSSPSLFVFSLTFFLTFSRVNSSQTNTLKKINRSVYFSLPPPPLFRYLFHQIDLSLSFCLMLLHIHAKIATKMLLHVRFPFFIFPPIFNCFLCLSVRKEKD